MSLKTVYMGIINRIRYRKQLNAKPEGLTITVFRKGRAFGVDIGPEWEAAFRQRSFPDFATQYLEPAFAQLINEADFQDDTPVQHSEEEIAKMDALEKEAINWLKEGGQ